MSDILNHLDGPAPSDAPAMRALDDLRDFFAASAPPVPDWFLVEVDGPLAPDESDLGPEEQAVVRDIVNGHVELDDESCRGRLRRAVLERRYYHQAVEAARMAAERERYYAWPWHYADAVLARRRRS